MPANTGTPPRHELVDIRFRNGIIVRGIDPAKYRWTLDDPKYPPSFAFDILDWQPCKP
ncbi:hypothetical protein [Sphingomonas sp. MA1305]|uniref:hypothetical protein n=1 Tax=Sphingomonas sp. MA1305 TaxID=2479204 RepID=UPI0018E03C0C|nr:hypothetical protein [Sphingomonas sp. MA1305]